MRLTRWSWDQRAFVSFFAEVELRPMRRRITGRWTAATPSAPMPLCLCNRQQHPLRSYRTDRACAVGRRVAPVEGRRRLDADETGLRRSPTRIPQADQRRMYWWPIALRRLPGTCLFISPLTSQPLRPTSLLLVLLSVQAATRFGSARITVRAPLYEPLSGLMASPWDSNTSHRRKRRRRRRRRARWQTVQ